MWAKNHFRVQPRFEDSELNVDSTISLGEVETSEDLCLVFPNFMQHRVSEFELVDKEKEGSRKFLCFFLIDPDERLLSTKDVEPQQEKISLEDARMYRELLMFQRKFEISDQNNFFQRGFSLCEH